MLKSETLNAGNGHALVRFNEETVRRFSPDTSYISISIRRISLRKGRINLAKFGPYLFGVLGQTNFDAQTKLAGVFSPAVEDALMAGASTQMGSQVGAPTYGEEYEAEPPSYGDDGDEGLPAPPPPIMAESFRRLDRVLLIDKQLTPRLVFRGEGPMQIGFGGILQKDYLADTFGVLEAVVKSPVAQFVSSTAPAIGQLTTALDVASTVHSAFQRLSDRKGVERLAMLDLNLRSLFDETGLPRAGKYALIAKDDVPAGLSVDLQTGEIRTHRGGEYDDAPYVVFELRCEDTRPDWGSVPEVNSAWRTLEHQVMTGETHGALEAFRRAVYLSPDLVPADSERIFKAARRKLGPLLSGAESFGLVGRLGTVAQALKQTYDQIKSAPSVTNLRDEWARFHRCHTIMRINEGGFVDHPDDPGGATNMGVTQATYDAWRIRKHQPTRSVRDIEEVEVQQIYYEGYWRAGHCHKMPDDASALVLFDACVNHGHKPGMTFIQRGAGLPSSAVDGVYGSQTQAAIARTDPGLLVRRALDARWAFFERIMERNPGLESFRHGWRNRVDRMRQIAFQWTTGQESIGADLALLMPGQLAAPVFEDDKGESTI
ncbi:MAG: hypothetical protein MRY64_10245 [Hyphomonadaceae bacterium]|nr:hypothetical protein [Hyphomonadaceae bacterium]